MTEEEKRILYVAITRAREQLYLSASVKEPESFLEIWKDKEPSEGINFAAWLIASLGKAPAFGGIRLIIPSRTENREKAANDALSFEKKRENVSNVKEHSISDLSLKAAKKLVQTRFSFRYADEELTSIPAKISVSNLIEKNTPQREKKEERKIFKKHSLIRPKFMDGQTTGADRGTATHTFLQFSNFNRLEKEGIDSELNRLVQEDYITRNTADLIQKHTIEVFLKSNIFHRMKNAKELRRELRFNLYLPARIIPGKESSDDAKVLVQGIIDCLFTDEDGKTVLLDYKTDFFSAEERKDKNAVIEILCERHKKQLYIYKVAAETMLCRKIDDARIYSFALGEDFTVLTD